MGWYHKEIENLWGCYSAKKESKILKKMVFNYKNKRIFWRAYRANT